MKNINMGRCPRGSFSYRIKSGDTLYKLAQTYNTTVEDIMYLNPGINPKNLQIGQMICIPEKSHGKRCPKGSFEYTIKSGDTLYKLAQTYNTTVEDLMRLNPGIDPYNLQIGHKICIPEKMPRRCPRGSFEYTIKSGDTFYFLSIRYNTTVKEIMALNPGAVPENLQIGQKICIPESHSYPKYPDHRDDKHYRDDDYYREPDYYDDDKYHREPKDHRDDEHYKYKCDGTLYTIKAGDTLYEIANKYNIRVKNILRENPDLDPNNLKIGQLICIPK